VKEAASTPRADWVALDTGPLLTHLTLHSLGEIGADKARRDAVLRDVRRGSGFGEIEQERFSILLDRCKQVLTTSYVIAEVLRIREVSELSKDEERFRRLSTHLLIDSKIEEIPCPLTQMCAESDFRELTIRLGLADASMIYLASWADKPCLLLTDDRRMFGAYPPITKFEIRLLDEFLHEAD
jgi:hypothetical protein